MLDLIEWKAFLMTKCHNKDIDLLQMDQTELIVIHDDAKFYKRTSTHCN